MIKNIFLLFVCFCFHVSAAERIDLKMIDKHIDSYANKMKQKGFYLFGSGGAMMDNIKRVNLDFDLQRKVDIDEARELLIEITEDFLNQINSDEKIRPYLNNFPFGHLNAEISISFKDKSHVYLREGVACVMTVGNKICYSKSNVENGPLINICKETYEDAVNKIKQQKAQLKNTPGS